MSLTTTATPRTIQWRRALRGWVFWAVVVVLLAGVATVLLWPAQYNNLDYDPANSGRNGMRALAQVLAQQGVSITTVHSESQLAALGDPSEPTTLVITNSDYGSPSIPQLSHYSTVVALGPDAIPASMTVNVEWYDWSSSESIASGCPSSIVGNAQMVTSDSSTRVSPSQPGDTVCFADAGAGLLLHRVLGAGATLDVLIDPSMFTNSAILHNDQAALALTLLGRHPHLVWLSVDPLSADPAATGAASGPDPLLSRWYDPTVALLIWTALVAMLWQGRRFGRLVREPLPVVIKAIETTQSRGRLYQHTRATNHSLAALQEGTRRRLLARLALPKSTPPDDLVRSVAEATGREPSQVWDLLHAPPASERDFVARAQGLAALEQEVHLR